MSAFQAFTRAHVGDDAPLEDVGFAVELLGFFAFGHHGTQAGGRVEAGNAGAAGAQAFGERALRRELDFELAREELALEFGILTHVGGDHFLDLARCQQQAQSPVIHAGIVAGDGEVAHAGIAKGRDKRFRDAAKAKAADGQQHAVADDAVEGGTRIGIELIKAAGKLKQSS